MRKKPNYGIDSPGIVLSMFFVALIAFCVAALLPHLFRLPMRWIALAGGAYFLQGATGMLFYSKVGKLRLREQLLDLIPWGGDEAVLDIGCGRGLLLIAAAGRLTTGKAVGVDVWNRSAISGNQPEGALENARIVGVSDRVEIREGDAKQLPLVDNSFDVVVSNFVLHEMDTQTDREKMVREMVRVLKPGGYVGLVDFMFTGECVRTLKKLGLNDAQRLRVGSFSFWYAAILNLGMCQLYRVVGSKNGSKGSNG
jgi:arsenite methyltransferase